MKSLWRVVIYILFVISTSYSQDSWTKVYGGKNSDDGRAVINTFDNGYIFVCTTQSAGNGSVDIWLIKTNAFGDTLWTKTYGGSKIDAAENPNCIIETNDHCYIITGSSNSWGSSNNDFDLYVIKIDSVGNLIWEKHLGSEIRDDGCVVTTTEDNNYLLMGHNENLWLIKLDPDGNILWEKNYSCVYSNYANSLANDINGGFIMTGRIRDKMGNPYIWLCKADSNGDTLWTKTFTENINNQYQYQYGISVHIDDEENYSLICQIIDEYGSTFPHFLKVSSSGELIRSEPFKEKSEYEYPDIHISSAEKTNDNGYILTGEVRSSFSDIILIKLDAGFNTEWIHTSQNDNWQNWVRGWGVRETKNERFVISGWFDNNVILIKTDQDGNFYMPPYTDIANESHAINKYSLMQNYPNPFNPSTQIEYDVIKPCKVNLIVYNLKGQVITELVNSYQHPGKYSINLNMKEIPSGIYFYRIQMGDFHAVKKMVKIE